MKFSTPVELPERTVQLTPRSRVMLIGSCFTEHIGRHLSECLPASQLMLNPNGILYNPASICDALERLIAYPADDLDTLAFETADGWWHHWHFSTLFAAPSLLELKARLHDEQEKAHRVFRKLDVLLITLSTDHAYRLKEGPGKGLTVANCHKQPARIFDEAVLDFDGLCQRGDALLNRLKKSHPDLQIVFTLSPYRYAKYGMHENALSKARLLLWTDYLCQNHRQVSYFPAYEIITDELRDYRYYEPDMLHPTAQAADYVWERFCEWAFTPELKAYARERQALMRDLNHRPLHPDSAEYLRFRKKVEERRKLFEEKWNETWD